MSAPGFKRVVTGHDRKGRAVISGQGTPPSVFPLKGVPGTIFYDIWNTSGARPPSTTARIRRCGRSCWRRRPMVA